MDSPNRLRNYQRAPLEYTIAHATEGKLTAGGQAVGSTGNSDDNGAFIVIRTGAGIVAMPTDFVSTDATEDEGNG